MIYEEIFQNFHSFASVANDFFETNPITVQALAIMWKCFDIFTLQPYQGSFCHFRSVWCEWSLRHIFRKSRHKNISIIEVSAIGFWCSCCCWYIYIYVNILFRSLPHFHSALVAAAVPLALLPFQMRVHKCRSLYMCNIASTLTVLCGCEPRRTERTSFRTTSWTIFNLAVSVRVFIIIMIVFMSFLLVFVRREWISIVENTRDVSAKTTNMNRTTEWLCWLHGE